MFINEGGGVKGRLNNVKKNRRFGSGGRPLQYMPSLLGPVFICISNGKMKKIRVGRCWKGLVGARRRESVTSVCNLVAFTANLGLICTLSPPCSDHQFIAICYRWHSETSTTTRTILNYCKIGTHCRIWGKILVLLSTTKSKNHSGSAENPPHSLSLPQFRIHCRLAIYGCLPAGAHILIPSLST